MASFPTAESPVRDRRSGESSRTGPAAAVVVVSPRLWELPGLRQRLVKDGLLAVEGVASPPDLLRQCQRMSPCVLLIDEGSMESVDSGSFSAIADFGRAVQVLVCGERHDDRAVENYIRMGCMGFVAGELSPAVLRRALRALSRGEMWVQRRLTTRLLQRFLSVSSLPKLTNREQEVLRLVAAGRKNREIAQQLSISHETVRWHIRSLNSKLGARDRLEMAFHARDYMD